MTTSRFDSQEREVTQRIPVRTTPSLGLVRPPAPSSELLEQAHQSDVSREDVPLVTEQRMRLVEQDVLDIKANNKRQDERLEAIEKTGRSSKGWLQALMVLSPFFSAYAPKLQEWAASHPESAYAALATVLAGILGVLGRTFLQRRVVGEEPDHQPPTAHS